MAIDINSIHNLARAVAVQERNENNRRHPGSRDVKHETWEETNQKAAQNTIAILVFIAIVVGLWKFLKYLGKLSIKAFGPKNGRIINIVVLSIILFIPACSIVLVSCIGDGNDVAMQQRETIEIRKREKINAEKERVRNIVEKNAKERGIEGERLNVVLDTFDRRVRFYFNGGVVNKENAKEWLDRASQECWEELPKYDEPMKNDYLSQKLSEVKQIAEDSIAKLKMAKHLEKVGLVEYQISQVDNLKNNWHISTSIFEDAKVIIDKTVDNAIKEIKKY